MYSPGSHTGGSKLEKYLISERADQSAIRQEKMSGTIRSTVEKERIMTIAKVIEVLAEGTTFEAAVDAAVSEAGDTVRGIKHVYIEGIQALVEDDKVTKYRVDAKVTFLVEG